MDHASRRADDALNGYERAVIEDRASDAAHQGPLLCSHRHPSVRSRSRCHALQHEQEENHHRREVEAVAYCRVGNALGLLPSHILFKEVRLDF
eukprot:14120633-Heterocapsa_arctica.AAC.1